MRTQPASPGGRRKGGRDKRGDFEVHPWFLSTSYTCKETTHEVAFVIVFLVNQWSPLQLGVDYRSVRYNSKLLERRDRSSSS
jgi:hypothetical protein